MKRIATLLLLMAGVLGAQSLQFNFTSKTGKSIALEAASGPFVEIEPTAHAKTKKVTIPFNSTFSAWIDPLEQPPTANPVRVLFGTIRPTKGMNTLLVRLEQDGEKLKAVLKIAGSGHTVTKDSNPFAPADYPKPKKLDDGNWVLDLPSPLKPGDYALVSETESWHFRVPEAAPTAN